MAVSFVAFVVLLLTIVAPLLYILILSGKKPAPPHHRGGGNGRGMPPSPPGLPMLGHLHLLGSLPHRALRSVAAAHGPVVLLRLGRVLTVLVSSAAGAEEVMRTRDLDFASRPASAMADRLLYGRNVAFAPYGEYWATGARRAASASSTSSAVDLGELLVAYANIIVSRAAFGDESARGLYNDGDRGREVRKVLTEFQELFGTAPVGELLPWLGWVDAVRGLEGRIRRMFEAIDGLLEKVIDDHRRRPQADRKVGDDCDGGHRDFVDVFLDVHKNDKEYGIRLETNAIKAIILDMFAAGTDTASTVMEWAMAELVTHPRAMRKLQDEIRAAAGSTGSVSEDHLDGLRYLKAVIKETLRLHVPIPLLVPREPPADTEILGYHIPARTRVVINAWAIGRGAGTWEDAEEFVPERFLDSAVDYRGQDFELVPFAAGRRGCPGVGFAEATIEMALASLLYHFDWEAGNRRKWLDMSEMNGMTVHIKSGLPLVAKPWIP